MTGVTLTLTEHQYMELRSYDHGNPSWRGGGYPSKNLIRRDMLRLAPSTGKGFYEITVRGRAALEAFREKHGVKV